MVGSGKPSASHTRVTDWPRLAVAFTMLCLAWTVGGTEGKKDCQGWRGSLGRTRWPGEEALPGDPRSDGQESWAAAVTCKGSKFRCALNNSCKLDQ